MRTSTLTTINKLWIFQKNLFISKYLIFKRLKEIEEPIYQLDKKYPSEILQNF